MKLIKTARGLQLNPLGVGKAVLFAPSEQQNANLLNDAAEKGYYYPLMALKHLSALSTGLSGKNNVFIPNINDFKTNSLQKVVVHVPNIAATVVRRSNDTLLVTQLVLSDGYNSIAESSAQQPGMYSVSKIDNAIAVKVRGSGCIAPGNERKVVIADTRYAKPLIAAEEAAKKLDAMFGGNAALKCDFDLFYSPLSNMNGMRNYNPIQVTKAYGFAGLLADAMEQSRNQKGVEWVSERGGSVILTQALMTLAQKNMSFQHQDHIVKMCWSTSNPQPTFAAAKQLGMLVDHQLLTSASSVKASLAATLGNAARARDKNDSYSWKDYGKELYNGSMAVNAVVGIGALVGAAFVAAPAATAALTTVGTISSGIGGLQFLSSRIKKLRGYS